MLRAHDPLPRQVARSAAVIGLSAVVAWHMAAHFDPANVILVFMAGVVFVAATSRRAVSLCSIGLSIALFDVLFVAPQWGFEPSRPQAVFTLSFMVAIGLLVTALAQRVRREAAEAQRRAERLQALNALSLALAAATDDASVSRAVADTLHESLGVQARIDAAQGGEVVLEAEAPTDPAAREFIAGAAAQARLALSRLASEARSEAAAVRTESERLRNTLLSGISHDFRTPLTTIVGATTSLLEQDHALDPTAKRQLLHSVLHEAQRLHALTSTLLDLSRMQEGALQPRFEWCPADELVQEVLRALQPRLQGLQVQVAVPGDPPVWCDPGLVERVLANLLDNAIRHAPAAGRITIAAQHTPGHWQLSVADNGPGVPPGSESRIFQKFVRGDHGGNGTGLGLALCAAIADLHGGSIGVHNDSGAVFTLRIVQPTDGPADLER